MDDKFFRVPFASGGDKTVVADAPDSTGNVNFQEGYNSYYQLASDQGNYHPIERDYFNYLMFSITTVLKSLQTNPGAYDFIDSATNNGTAYPYAKGAVVRYGGARYISLVSNNTAQDPSTSPNWLALVESYVPMAGGTMTGPLILSQDATAAKGAVALEQLTAAVASLTASINAVQAYAATRAAADGAYTWQLVLTDNNATNNPNIITQYGSGFYRWTKNGVESTTISGCLAIFDGAESLPAPEYYQPLSGGAYGDDIFHWATKGIYLSGSLGSDYTFKLYKLIKSA